MQFNFYLFISQLKSYKIGLAQMILLAIIYILIATIQSKLQQVVSLTRHGARYHIYLNSNNSDSEFYGQLTAVGMRQQQKLGQMLRNQYILSQNFLSQAYNKSEIQVYCTYYNRTIQSIQSLLYGIYPPGTGPKLVQSNKMILPPYSNKTSTKIQLYALPNGYQPIKINHNQNVMLASCPNYNIHALKNFLKLQKQSQQLKNQYFPFYQKIGYIFNYTSDEFFPPTYLRFAYDIVNVHNFIGRKTHTNLTILDEQYLLNFANFFFYAASLQNNTFMLNSGKFKKIIEVFDERIIKNNTFPLKWTFLSGHDTDIIAMHLALNLSSVECSYQLLRNRKTSFQNCENGANHFTSNILFQLHSQNQQDYYVKIRSNEILRYAHTMSFVKIQKSTSQKMNNNYVVESLKNLLHIEINIRKQMEINFIGKLIKALQKNNHIYLLKI